MEEKTKTVKAAGMILLILLALFGIASFLSVAFGSGIYRLPDVGPLGVLCISTSLVLVFAADSPALVFLPILLYAIYLPSFFQMKKHPKWKTVLFTLFLLLHFLDMLLFRITANAALLIASDLLAISAATALYILSKKEISAEAGDKPGAAPTDAHSV
ncbi:MAG: hypothetical protein MJ070_08615 [Lachnospiraceae bacterium]|nr:hypothetical protein [Lachnospiraceae bacterium]